MSPARHLLLYSALRIGLFAVVFAGLLLLQVNPILAAVIAAVVGLCVAYIFFRPQRDAVASTVSGWRAAPTKDDDSSAEDAAIDGTGDSAARHPNSPAD